MLIKEIAQAEEESDVSEHENENAEDDRKARAATQVFFQPAEIQKIHARQSKDTFEELLNERKNAKTNETKIKINLTTPSKGSHKKQQPSVDKSDTLLFQNDEVSSTAVGLQKRKTVRVKPVEEKLEDDVV